MIDRARATDAKGPAGIARRVLRSVLAVLRDFLQGGRDAPDQDELASMSKGVLRASLALVVLGGAVALAWRPTAALALTGAGLVSSFSFRGLEMQVRSLEPRNDGRAGPWNTLFIVLRYSLFIAFLAAVPLASSREFVALILGFSVVPLALLISALSGSLRADSRACGSHPDSDELESD